MIGLIKKDLMLVKKQLFIVVFIMATYCFVFANGKSADYKIGMFSGYLIAFMAIIPITILAYDEKYKWGKYASAFPVTRAQQVISKFIIMLLLTLIGIAIFSIITLVSGGDYFDVLGQLASTFATALIVSSIMLTMAYKFGTDKARYLFMGLIFIITFGVLQFSGSELATDIDLKMGFVKENGFAIMCIVMGLVVYLACGCLSVNIYKNKDL